MWFALFATIVLGVPAALFVALQPTSAEAAGRTSRGGWARLTPDGSWVTFPSVTGLVFAGSALVAAVVVRVPRTGCP